MNIKYLLGFVLCASALFSQGCVTRELYITTEPEGANVTINETYRGKTPMTHKFVHYGTMGIRIEMEDYYPLYVEEKVAAPLYEKPGIDLVSEAFIPKKINDRREFHYVLQKRNAEEEPLEEIIKRADAMRAKVKGIAKEAEQKEQEREPLKLPLPVKESVKEAEALQKAQSENAEETTETAGK